MQYWLYLAIAIVLEVIGTTSMKLSEGFTKTIPSNRCKRCLCCVGWIGDSINRYDRNRLFS